MSAPAPRAHGHAAFLFIFITVALDTALMGLVGPTNNALMTRRVGPSEQGALQGALGSLRGITEMMGPVLFSESLAWSIRSRAPAPLIGAPFLAGAEEPVVASS